MRRRGYIAVEGPIGVGKTSLAQALAREFGARLMLEDADNNPFLPRFYQDPDKYAFPAQLYFLLTRHNQQRERKQQDLFAQATVADYLFAKDKIFAALNLAPDELKLYDNVYKLLDAEMAKPDLVVYVRAAVEDSLRQAGLPGPLVTIRSVAALDRDPLTGKARRFIPLGAGRPE